MRVSRRVKSMCRVGETILQLLASASDFIFTLGMMIFVFAQAGMCTVFRQGDDAYHVGVLMFGGKIGSPADANEGEYASFVADGWADIYNFNDLPSGFLTLILLIPMNDWGFFMDAFAEVMQLV